MLSITTPSRLHITLIDMNASLGRVDGGAGITLEEPCIRLRAERADTVIVEGSQQADRIRKAAEALLPSGSGIRIIVEKEYPPHVGLGSGTQAALAAGAAVNRLYGLGYSVTEIAGRVGRGGTSGIGVAAFESGGFILDGGHKFSEKGGFLPSAASRAPPPPVLLRCDFPWNIVVAIPSLTGASGKKEVDIFRRECPIPLGEVRELSHILLMKMLPSVIEKDMESFGDALNRVQEVGFKRRELALQDASVKKLMQVMRDAGACGAGMSSFGPTVFGVSDTPYDIKRAVEEHLEDAGGGIAFVTRPNNTGARLHDD